jgi:hypothetical protein
MLITTKRLPRRRNLATHSLFQRMYWRSIAQDINTFRVSLGLAPVSTPTATRLAAAGPLELQAYHPALVPDLADYPARRPIIGFLAPGRELRDRLGELDVDPETDAWLADGEPPGVRWLRQHARHRPGGDDGHDHDRYRSGGSTGPDRRRVEPVRPTPTPGGSGAGRDRCAEL